MAGLMDILSGAGAALDVPGSMVRNTLSGRNPLQPLTDPFSWEGRATGRDLLQQYGLAGEDPSGANMAGGYLAEMALDPLTWGGAGLLARGLGAGAKGARAAATASKAAKPARAAARPAVAASIATPALGAYMLGDNMSVPPEEQEAWKNWVGAGLMAAPLAMAGAKGLKGLGKGRQAQQVQAPKEGPFYSRLEEALLNAPEKFEQMPDRVVKGMPDRQVQISPSLMGHRSKVTKTIKGRPEQRTPGQTAHEQLQGYLSERAHPQEIDWVLGQQLKDAPEITKSSLMELFDQKRIGLEAGRHGGTRTTQGYEAGVRGAGAASEPRSVRQVPGPFESKEAATAAARTAADSARGRYPGAKPVVREIGKPEHGDLTFPDMLIPGGKNATEVPIRLGGKPVPKGARYEVFDPKTGQPKSFHATEVEAINATKGTSLDYDLTSEGRGQYFPDTKGHFGDDVVAWTIHDQRTMPDGTKMRFVQEIQSDWHQAGAKQGYGGRAQQAESLKKQLQTGEITRDQYNTARGKLMGGGDIPDAPFKGNEWVKLGIKQDIADAIEAGDDIVAFANPELVSRAQGMPIEKARAFYGEMIPNLVNEQLKPYGVKLERMPLPGTKIGKKEFIASRTDYSMEDLRLAGKGQIDEIAKTAGWKPGMQEEVLGFRIPAAMKKQAKTRGFPMLSVGGPIAGATGAQTLRSLLRREPEEA